MDSEPLFNGGRWTCPQCWAILEHRTTPSGMEWQVMRSAVSLNGHCKGFHTLRANGRPQFVGRRG